MSKIIRMTPEIAAECRRDFESALSSAKMSDGKINFTKVLPQSSEKATVFFSQKAYLKTVALINSFDSEVAWHGVAVRGEDTTKHEYTVKDILVYPQEVTGATVNTDQVEYQTWLYELDDDTFNNLRFQAHSHVNMGVTPSSVDLANQERMLEQLHDDMFYIFMIFNKKMDVSCKIYDMGKNILFETGDVSIKVESDGLDLSAFVKGAKESVKNKTYSATSWQKGVSAAKSDKTSTSVRDYTTDYVSDLIAKKKAVKASDIGYSSSRMANAHSYSCYDDDDDEYFGYGRENYRDPYFCSGT